jgi:GNAT superfamily N-acetyltransferase
VRVRAIDPNDRGAFDAWYAVMEASDEERWGDPLGGLSRRELHAAVAAGAGADGDGATEYQCLAALDESGHTVGIGLCEIPRRDNQHGASIDIRVDPAHRRQGIGTAILADAEQRLVAAGRSILTSLIETPSARVGHEPSTPFARAAGFVVTQTGHRRDLALPLSNDRLERLRGEIDRAGGDYLVRTFTAPWPRQFLADQLELFRRMSTDAPSGDELHEEEMWDAARVEEWDRRLSAQGMTKGVAVAQHRASGRLVAFSELALPEDHPAEAWQYSTLVLREHRGHRLGLAVKLANVEHLAATFPRVTLVVTANAQENAPMIAVNEMLGFEVAATGIFWRKQIGT